jgi:hypothetical protein
MTLHLGYPTITKGHKLMGVTPVAKLTELTGIPPVAKINKAHRHPTCSQPRTMLTGFAPIAYHESNQLDSNQLDPVT